MAAVLAALDMTAESGGAAGLDGRHDLELAEAEVAGMGRPEGRAVSAEDVGDLEQGAHASAGGCGLPHAPWGLEHAELVERAGHRAHRSGRDLGVERGVVQLGVPERPRAIMRPFYVTAIAGSVGLDPMLAGTAERSARNRPPTPVPRSPTALLCTADAP